MQTNVPEVPDVVVGLRARKRLATSEALRDAAVTLFTEQGYDHTTVEQIATKAGVSPRTFFRYYATKDDILYGEHQRREAALAAFLAKRPEGEPVRAALEAVVVDLASDVQERNDLAQVQTQLWMTAPRVMNRFLVHHETLITMISEHVAATLGVDAGLDLRPRTLAGAAVRAWLTACRSWVGQGLDQPLVPLAQQAFAMVRFEMDGVDR